ncbi:hypothetical protein [Nocardioides sp. zg-1230]|uniref:hypothetical protein n=1 Tax=Nocardioides sp. zg-1230 TaxID=2736601 RepID=UPI0015539834|nr:hypothetical protein [Nocardioides sp. zg-1230]NPC44579.1 hypothetical protein [Nocardioides sp. zg-1230]
MSTDLGTLGRTAVAHRLALAVVPLDAVTRHEVPPGVLVGRETARSMEHARRRSSRGRPDPERPTIRVRPAAGAYVVLHDATVPRVPPDGSPPGAQPVLTVRIVDPAGRWIPRRCRVPVWPLPQVRAPEDPVLPGPAVPAASRSIRPWLLPGPAYAVAGGGTAVRLRVVRGGIPVRWARAEVFDGAGQRLGWGHGDAHGEVLVVLDQLGPGMPTADVQVAVRVHRPGPLPAGTPAVTARDLAADPLADLPVEVLPRQQVPAGSFEDDATIGVAVPNGFVTAAVDLAASLTPGRAVRLPDISFTP